jgi:hypothetical protein
MVSREIGVRRVLSRGIGDQPQADALDRRLCRPDVERPTRHQRRLVRAS